MFLSQFVQNINWIQPSIVADGSGDHFQGLGEGIDDQLGFPLHASGVLSEVSGEFQFNGTTTLKIVYRNE